MDTATLYKIVNTKNPTASTPMVMRISGVVGQ
jgi:hypothetical protein